jgi:hypothetical protein
MITNEPRFNSRTLADLRTFIGSLRPTHMITVNYPKPLSGGREARQQALRTDMRRWNRNVLEAMFGRKFSVRNLDNAFVFVGVIETGIVLGKEHIHALCRVPAEKQAAFENRAAQLWPGTTDVHLVRIHEQEGAIRYCTKDVRSDCLIFSNEFRKSR